MKRRRIPTASGWNMHFQEVRRLPDFTFSITTVRAARTSPVKFSLSNSSPLAYTSPTLVQVSLPSAAKTSSTAIRWRQISNSGANNDEWSLNYIIFSLSGQVPSVVPVISFPADFFAGQTFG